MPVTYRRQRQPPPPEDTGPGAGTLAAGGAAALAAALLTRKPGLLRTAASKLNALRYTGMLSGLAAPKSIAGNIGAGVIASAEGGTLRPLKALFSRQTGREFIQALKQGGTVGPVPGGAEATAGETVSRLNPFGRVMGAGDVATRAALTRGGVAPEEAERLVLQSPLPREWAEKLDNPVAKFLLPFRRTPFNYLAEGMGSFAPAGKALAGEVLTPLERRKLATLGGAMAAGGATGLATEEQGPGATAVPLALGGAAAGTYGIPFVGSAALARFLLGQGTKASAERAVQGVSPFSEYGFVSSITDPLRPFREPAVLRYTRRRR